MQGAEKKAEEVDSRQLVGQELVQDLEVEKLLLTFHHHQKLAKFTPFLRYCQTLQTPIKFSSISRILPNGGHNLL